MVTETKRTIWQMADVRIFDGGPDGQASPRQDQYAVTSPGPLRPSPVSVAERLCPHDDPHDRPRSSLRTRRAGPARRGHRRARGHRTSGRTGRWTCAAGPSASDARAVAVEGVHEGRTDLDGARRRRAPAHRGRSTRARRTTGSGSTPSPARCRWPRSSSWRCAPSLDDGTRAPGGRRPRPAGAAALELRPPAQPGARDDARPHGLDAADADAGGASRGARVSARTASSSASPATGPTCCSRWPSPPSYIRQIAPAGDLDDPDWWLGRDAPMPWGLRDAPVQEWLGGEARRVAGRHVPAADRGDLRPHRRDDRHGGRRAVRREVEPAGGEPADRAVCRFARALPGARLPRHGRPRSCRSTQSAASRASGGPGAASDADYVSSLGGWATGLLRGLGAPARLGAPGRYEDLVADPGARARRSCSPTSASTPRQARSPACASAARRGAAGARRPRHERRARGVGRPLAPGPRSRARRGVRARARPRARGLRLHLVAAVAAGRPGARIRSSPAHGAVRLPRASACPTAASSWSPGARRRRLPRPRGAAAPARRSLDAVVPDAHLNAAVAGHQGPGRSRPAGAGRWGRAGRPPGCGPSTPPARAVCPSVVDDPRGYAARLRAAGGRRRARRGVPEPRGDHRRDARDGAPGWSGVILPFPAARVLNRVRDKERLASTAVGGRDRHAGRAVPRPGAASCARTRFGRPVVVKPARPVSRAEDGPARARPQPSWRRCSTPLPDDEQLLVQERVRGPIVSVELVLDREGNLVARFQHVTRRTWPSAAGSIALATSVEPDEALVYRTASMLADIGYWGLAQVDFVDTPSRPRAAGRQPALLPLPAARHRVRDEPARAVARGHRRPAVGSPGRYRVGVTYRWLEADFAAAARGAPRQAARTARRSRTRVPRGRPATRSRASC